MKIIFIVGPSGTGKTTYIRKNYPVSDQVAVFDLAGKSWKLFQDFQALNDDRIYDIYNKSSEEAFLALMDGKDLVVEYCANGEDDELYSVINHAKKAGLRTEVIFLTADADIAWERVQKAGPNYFSSYQTKEDTLEVLSGVIGDYVFNQDFEKICEVGSEGGSINFFRYKKDEQDVFFFTTDETALIEFEPEFEFEKEQGLAYTEEFTNFRDAFEALLEKYPIFRLYPLEVSSTYKREFKEAYQSFLNVENPENQDSEWIKHLN